MKMSQVSLAPPKHPTFILPGKLRKSPTQSIESRGKDSSPDYLGRTGPASRMTSIHAKVLWTEKYADQYRLIIELVPSEFLGPFERLRFKKNPYCGSFVTSLTKSWLTLDYRKDPGFKAGEPFPIRRTD